MDAGVAEVVPSAPPTVPEDDVDNVTTCWKPVGTVHILGHCEGGGNLVEWLEVDGMDAAIGQFDVLKTNLRRSVVLFETQDGPIRGGDDVVHIPIMTSGQHCTDVAVILAAMKCRKEQIEIESGPSSTTLASLGTTTSHPVDVPGGRPVEWTNTTTTDIQGSRAKNEGLESMVPDFCPPGSTLSQWTNSKDEPVSSSRRGSDTKRSSFSIPRRRSGDLFDAVIPSSFPPTWVNRQEVEEDVQNGDAPMVPPSRSWLYQNLMKRSVDCLFYRPTVAFFAAGPHRMTSLYSFPVHKYPGVRGHIALTIDDAPSRFGPRNSRLDEIRSLLDRYDAKATFMVVGKFIPGHEQQMVQLLKDGHEFGNHGMADHALDVFDNDDTFLEALDGCNALIDNIHNQYKTMMNVEGRSSDEQPSRVRYFRAPHGKYTKRMEDLVHGRGMVNVMCDAYAADPIVEDGDYIARSLTRQSRDGGIILLHVPERGFRDYCLVALEGLLEGLKQRQLKVVSVSMLEALATQDSTV